MLDHIFQITSTLLSAAIQNKVKRYMRRYRQEKRMRLVGPNCVGVITPRACAIAFAYARTGG